MVVSVRRDTIPDLKNRTTIFILRWIPLDKKESVTTIGAQSGKKWVLVAESVE
jgi:hypothetical protein